MEIYHLIKCSAISVFIFLASCVASSPEEKVHNLINAINQVTKSIENNDPDVFITAMDKMQKISDKFEQSDDATWLEEHRNEVEVEVLGRKLSFAMRDLDSAIMGLRTNREFAKAFATDARRLKWLRETAPGLANMWNLD